MSLFSCTSVHTTGATREWLDMARVSSSHSPILAATTLRLTLMETHFPFSHVHA